MALIERHWDLEHGRCARCRQPARCERAHIIDRCFGGLDGPQNLIPLCYPCHDRQPSFSPGDEPLALAWVFDPNDSEPDVDADGWFERGLERAGRVLAAVFHLQMAASLTEAAELIARHLRGGPRDETGVISPGPVTSHPSPRTAPAQGGGHG